MKVLVTGGAGFIGSHTCLALMRAGHIVHVVDSLHNGHMKALRRVERLSNCRLDFTQLDIRDSKALDCVFTTFKPHAVIHFAGLKSVSESISEPALYYEVNVGGTAALLRAMERASCQSIVFSSSATVYGTPRYLPCDEKHPLNPINPYGRTKLIGEQLLKDWASVDPERKAIALRYFNPVGADSSGEIGEDPSGVPNNLMPIISQVAIGRLPEIHVYGNDYETYDGTGIRDYVHVVDLALAHLTALEKQDKLAQFEALNIGRGTGISVLQIIEEFGNVSNRHIKYNFKGRRPGDAAEVWADTKLAELKLNFVAKRGLKEMCADTWKWQSTNPKGFSN